MDRSIEEPGDFIQTNVYGPYVLLEATRKFGLERMLQVSTDEVYGEVMEGSSTETDLLKPRSPYSSAKAAANCSSSPITPPMTRPYWSHAARIPTAHTSIPRSCSRSSSPMPWKTSRCLSMATVCTCATGSMCWTTARGIDIVLHKGQPGEIYNVGGGNERHNIDVTYAILDCLGKPRTLINYVEDRHGHDRRYSVDTTKARALGWQPRKSFEEGLKETVDWYANNRWWWEKIKSGEFAQYYARMYEQRKVLRKHED